MFNSNLENKASVINMCGGTYNIVCDLGHPIVHLNFSLLGTISLPNISRAVYLGIE